MGGGAGRFGWLGGKHRRTELSSGVIQMGVRSYVPSIGRFLTPDPILGGSANAYEYASGDPINNLDLTGEKCASKDKEWIKRCVAMKRQAAVRRIRAEIARTLRAVRRQRAAEGRGRIGIPKFDLTPWEKDVNEQIDKARGVLRGTADVACGKGANIALGAGVAIERGGEGLAVSGYAEVGAVVKTLGKAVASLGALLSLGRETGVC